MGKPVERQNHSFSFFILASLIAICTAWSFYEEFLGRRPWKDFQKRTFKYEQSKAAGDLAEGTINSNVATVDGPQPPHRRAIIDAYHKRYNQEFDDTAGFFATYDAMMLYAIAMEQAGFEPKAVRAALENIPKFQGLSLNVNRPVFTKGRHDGTGLEDMMLGRWTSGKFLQVGFDDKGPYVNVKEGIKTYIDPKTFALKQ